VKQYVVYLGNHATALREKDGRVVPSTERFSIFSKKDAGKVKDQYEKQGGKVTLRVATDEEVQWLRGGFRTGSDWNTEEAK